MGLLIPAGIPKQSRIALQKATRRLESDKSPTFANLTLTDLTALSLIYPDSNKKLTSLGVATNGQLPIGSTGAVPILATITGTTNQITVTSGAGSITLSTPQDIHTGASPTFIDITATGDLKSGVNDTTAGNLHLYGAGTGSADGGCAKWYTGADYDTSINYYAWNVDEDDFVLKVGTTNKLLLAGNTGNFTSTTDWTINDLTISTPSNIYALNHDSFTGFVTNEHIDHSSVSIVTATNSGLEGGGNITTTRNLVIKITASQGDVTLTKESDGLKANIGTIDLGASV